MQRPRFHPGLSGVCVLLAVASSAVLTERAEGGTPSAAGVPARPSGVGGQRLADRESARGQALFFGTAPLTGRIRDHRTALPAQVVKCVNCHGTGAVGPANKDAAPALDRALLVEERVRRGGPPSAYDLEGFCKVLRTGVDPVHILIAREMPIYQLDDAACSALWRFLTKEKSGEAPAERTPRDNARDAGSKSRTQ